MGILVVNAGSSSLKLAFFDSLLRERLASASVEWPRPEDVGERVLRIGTAPEVRSKSEATDRQNAAMAVMRDLIDACPSQAVEAIGHRVVHGGARYGESVIVDDLVREDILRLAELAPLHNQPAVSAMDAAMKVLPGVTQVAVFDTAFYRELPPEAIVYPLPYAWYSEWGYYRFGFHGISHSHCAARAAEMLAQSPGDLRVVSLHLGNGCSATAMRGGKAVETTMGFTPMDGLMMGSRSGSIDPGILLHAMKHRGLSVDQLDNILNQESGLKGVSGLSSDYRTVAAAARQGHERAGLALEIYARRVRSAVGALAATLGGIDVLVFTAGVGENQPELRAAVCGGLGFLGLEIDAGQNMSCRPDSDVSNQGSKARILVVHAQEEIAIARETLRLMALSPFALCTQADIDSQGKLRLADVDPKGNW